MIRRAILASVSAAIPALCLGAGGARAAGDSSHCQQIQNPDKRLQCYDQAAGPGDDDLLARIVLKEIACRRKPRTAEAIETLVNAGIAVPKPFKVADSLNFFSLQKPMTVDGLTIVAVFGFDETRRFPFVRSPGTSPGFVFGVVTKEDLAAADQWRGRHGQGLELNDSYSGLKGAKEISCSKLAGDD